MITRIEDVINRQQSNLLHKYIKHLFTKSAVPINSATSDLIKPPTCCVTSSLPRQGILPDILAKLCLQEVKHILTFHCVFLYTTPSSSEGGRHPLTGLLCMHFTPYSCLALTSQGSLQGLYPGPKSKSTIMRRKMYFYAFDPFNVS